jgi:hypothetical protein
MALSTQTLTVLLAFVASAASFTAVAVRFVTDGSILVTPLAGGVLMLILGIGGYLKVTRTGP